METTGVPSLIMATFSSELLEQHAPGAKNHVPPHRNVTSTDNINVTSYDYGSDDYVYAPDYGYITDFESYARYILHQPTTIIGLVLSVVSLVANIISIVAVLQIRKSWNAHVRILLSLMASDILVSASYIIHIINEAHNPTYTPGTGPPDVLLLSRCSYMSLKALNTMGLNITLLNILVMAIDHYIAILKPLNAHHAMGKKRCIATIVTIWGIAFVTGFSDFLTPLLDTRVWTAVDETFNYCDVVWRTRFQEEFTTFAISFICFTGITFIYMRIYCKIKGKHPTNIVHNKSIANKKALVTTMLILGTFVVCWLPICIFSIVIIICTSDVRFLQFIYNHFETLMIVDKSLYTLMLLNTLCDPVIYAIRISEIRTGYQLLWERIRYGKSDDIAWYDGYTSRRCSSQASWSNGYMPYHGARRKSELKLEVVVETPMPIYRPEVDRPELNRLLQQATTRV
jgi:hypothetical protein